MMRMILVAIVMCGLTEIVSAQEADSQASSQADMQLSVISLEKLDLYEAAKLIDALVPGARVYVSESIGGLVIRTDPGTLRDVVRLIAELEAQVPDVAGPRTEVVRVKHRRVEDILRQLRMTVGGQCQLAGDNATGQLIVRGRSADVKMVRELVERLDLPQQTVTLIFDYLRVVPVEKGSSSGPSLPSRLLPVRDALLKSGFFVTEAIGHTLVQCADGEEFNVESTESDGGHRIRYRIEGHTQFVADAERIRITVETWLDRKTDVPEGRHEIRREFQAQTRVVTGFDESVVLAALPSGDREGEGSVVIVVRALRPAKP